ncbi:hypothetical protein [Caldisphaera sp.]|uniref:phosphotransferase n=1 Tax=Caldisphaera sp. TaxID=2060322 RepID=UPI0025BB53B2|nr:hypothetical protein [Caldisphaera sp.]
MKLEYLIVQCGGLGSRMQYLTANKPKCLISVFGSPLILHLNSIFNKPKFIVIGKYKYQVLKNYLKLFEDKINFKIVYSKGNGSISGIKRALDYIPPNKPFGIVWSDILFTKKLYIQDVKENYIGITNNSYCRWTLKNGKPTEEGGNKNGIFGFFIFKDKEEIKNLPTSGEFVRFLKESNIPLKPYIVNNVYEVGSLEKYNILLKETGKENTRFFNEIKIKDGIVTKIARYKEFDELIKKESNWYRYVMRKGYENIPKIISLNPLKMELINGKHPFEINSASITSRKYILNQIIDALIKLHEIDEVAYDLEEDIEVLVNKTTHRLNKVESVLPKNKMEVNGKKINIKYKDLSKTITKAFRKIHKSYNFCVIHGDPTFSNTLITKRNEIKFIDPRGYYGKKLIYGNPMYDFAKLYYSCIGNYDQFNLRNFRLTLDLNQNKASINIVSNNYEEAGWEVFNERFSKSEINDIKIMHALIWLALTGYVIDDYDSIIGAYLKGLLELKEVAII